jgi:4-hydroxybenzoate polyprenyltransferase
VCTVTGNGVRTSAIGLVRACHPEPTVAVTAVATALAVAAGRGAAGAVAVAVAVLSGQLSVGWSNDLIDRDRDRERGRQQKPIVAGLVAPTTVRRAAVIALVATVPLSLLSGISAATVHVVAVLAAWAYNLRIKSTVLSVLPYVVAFGLLPAFVTLGLPGAPWPPWWAVTAGALLGAGAHFANVVPDITDDLATGVRGLPQRLGRETSSRLAAVFLLAASLVLVFGPGHVGPVTGVGLAIATVLAGVAGIRGSFRAVLLVALLNVALLLARGSSLH